MSDAIAHLRAAGVERIQPTATAEAGWVQHVNDFAELTLYPHANSWYIGANVPGKPRVFLPYVGGVGTYRRVCDEVVERDYLGFTLSSARGSHTNDGVIRPLQPDVMAVLELFHSLHLPPMEHMTPGEAREFSQSSAATRPPGPKVGEMLDGTLPGADGKPSQFRLYRPDTEGPHPVVVYFHGGGWVLGSHVSDEPLCRDLCRRSNAAVLSVDYRHAPEAPFPAAVCDAIVAVRWVAEQADDLAIDAARLVVAGWSAGANLAAVACQLARDSGGPAIAGQILLTPVTDGSLSTQSYEQHSDGYLLTRSLMRWFWDQYCGENDRDDPRASPLRCDDLAGLPPALVLACEFDPLRDEGKAYADALAAAGVSVRYVEARGHTHTSVTMVDVVPSGAVFRAELGASVREFLRCSSPIEE